MARDAAVRNRILDAAVGEINAHGTGGLRIQAVCDAANVTAPIIYRHFGGREGLIEEVQVERYLMTVRKDAEDFAEAAEKCDDRDDVRRLVRQAVSRTFRQNPELRWARLNVLGSAYARPELEARLMVEQDRVVGIIAGALRSLKDRGLTRPDLDPDTFAMWQHGLLFSRVFFERGSHVGSASQWDKTTLDAVVSGLMGEE